MKKTPIFEEVFHRLLAEPGFWLKLLIGGLLSFVPVANIFAFGYLYRFSVNTRRSGALRLPAWDDWKGLFVDGLKFAVVWIAYWLLPILIVMGISGLLGMIGLGAMSYILISLTFLFSPVIFSSALYRLQMRADFKDLLDVVLIIRMTYSEARHFAIPAFVFMGIFALALPIYGFALFFGFLILIAYTSICYRSIENASRMVI
ncbi:MAG: DUF4013 domain-containing protein [Verrucomicrobiota bacterium]